MNQKDNMLNAFWAFLLTGFIMGGVILLFGLAKYIGTIGGCL